MKFVLGLIMVIAGIIFGIYAGLWWAFIGGIVDIVSAIRAPEIIAMDIAIGIAKVMFAGVIGVISGFIAVAPGYVLLKSD